MEIDPLETIITWLESALTIVNGRVASKHRYGDGWSEEQTGVSVHMDGGPSDIYVPVVSLRLEFRIYASDQVQITDVWRELIALSRENSRFVVATSKGSALVHYFLPQSNMSLLFDDVLKMDMGIVFFEAKIAEKALSGTV